MTLFLTPLKQNYLTRTPSSRTLTPTQTVTRSSLPPCLGKELSLSLAPIPLPPSTPTPFIPFILMHHMCRETRPRSMRSHHSWRSDDVSQHASESSNASFRSAVGCKQHHSPVDDLQP
uniref:Uncharacterized protein n=1 Tax=Cacopsylla melanoneura TaxID=428564 RepID=A0A8D8S844_9HEMI